MTLGGWITFLISAGAFTFLFAWCLTKVLTAKRPKNDDIGTAFELFEEGKLASRGKKKSKKK